MDQLAPCAAGYGGIRSLAWHGTVQFVSDFTYALGQAQQLIKIWFAKDRSAAKVLRKVEEEFVQEIDAYQQQFKKEWPLLEFHCICEHGDGDGKHLDKCFAC